MADDQKPHSLSDHIESLLEQLREMLPKASRDFDATAIHKSRVATRRIKAALNLLSPVLHANDCKPLAKVGKKLRRQLGPLRDLDVMLGHLAELKDDSLATAVAWFEQRLMKQRDDARRKSIRKLNPSNALAKLRDWSALKKRVIEADCAVPSLLAESLHVQLDSFVERADNLAHHDPHELRITAKALRYTLELAAAHGQSVPEASLKQFKKMQDSLGDWHDFVVIAQTALQASLDEDLALHDATMQRDILKLADVYLQDAQKSLEGFESRWRDEGHALSAAIREKFPLTHSVTESKTDHDPVDSAPSPIPELPTSDAPPSA